ncbi:MAG: PAS domain S-box protein, partial [Oscillatoria sp. PMC 1076.18]|nr:PAS domain S-box protein [Oscillatoria sp. PMC 1076.18]
MNFLPPNIITPNHIDYLVVNRELIILSYSSGATRFVAFPNNFAIGDDIRNGLPELFGCEEILVNVLEGNQNNFCLKSIARPLQAKNNLYFDLYFNSYIDVKSHSQYLIIFLEDVTDKISLEQTLVQRTNETQLLLNALEKSQSYLNQIVASIADSLVITTQTGQIKRINQATVDLFGYSEAELLTEKISYLSDDPDFDLLANQKNLIEKKETQV